MAQQNNIQLLKQVCLFLVAVWAVVFMLKTIGFIVPEGTMLVMFNLIFRLGLIAGVGLLGVLFLQNFQKQRTA